MNSTSTSSSRAWLKLAVIAVVAAAMACLVIAHTPGLSGPWYWRWPWRRLEWSIYPTLLIASAPFFVAQWLYVTGRIKLPVALAILTASTFVLQFAALIPQPLGIGRTRAVIENSVNTSYYDMALVLHRQMRQHGNSMRDWMEIYPELMPKMVVHASFKPPGWICYYLTVIRMFGDGPASAWAGAIGIALIASLAVPSVYRLAREFDLDESPAFCAASFFSLLPALILMFPQGDQTYPTLACWMLIVWRQTLRRKPWMGAVLFGALLALALFYSAAFLMLGLFLAVQTLLSIADGRGRALGRAIQASILAICVAALLYVLLWAATGFDPVETFLTAGRRSQADLVKLQRPWPLHWFFDFADIALATGWISVPLVIFGAIATAQHWNWRSPQFRLVFVGLLQAVMSVLVSVFPGENARLMLPIMPLLMAPVGIELCRWPARQRMLAYAILVLVIGVIAQNMIFLYMGPEIDLVPR